MHQTVETLLLLRLWCLAVLASLKENWSKACSFELGKNLQAAVLLVADVVLVLKCGQSALALQADALAVPDTC